MPTIFTDSLNGVNIAYSSETVFLVQTGKGKSSYKTKYIFVGHLGRAVVHYNCINIGKGFKKRLKFGLAFGGKTIIKQFN